MSLALVTEHLGRYAAAAGRRAAEANHPDTALAMQQAQQEMDRLRASIECAVIELAGYRKERAVKAAKARRKAAVVGWDTTSDMIQCLFQLISRAVPSPHQAGALRACGHDPSDLRIQDSGTLLARSRR